MTEEKDKLMPCPFCGARPKVGSLGGGCFENSYDEPCKQKMLDKWNTRHTDLKTECEPEGDDMIVIKRSELELIDLALRASRCVFERLKYKKPDDHVYHGLFNNCDKALKALQQKDGQND